MKAEKSEDHGTVSIKDEPASLSDTKYNEECNVDYIKIEPSVVEEKVISLERYHTDVVVKNETFDDYKCNKVEIEAVEDVGSSTGTKVKQEFVTGHEDLQPPDVHQTEWSFKLEPAVIALQSNPVGISHQLSHNSSGEQHESRSERSSVETAQNMQVAAETKLRTVHTLEELPTLSHSCNVCSKRYSTRKLLIRHLNIHTGAHCCGVCSKRFTCKFNLDVHLMTHAGDRPHSFSCDVCSKHFKLKSNIIRHLRTPACQRFYRCYVCRKHFTSKFNLTRHAKVHADETHGDDRSHSCNVCNKSFTAKNALAKHQKVHIKAHCCEICSKGFTSRSNLISHLNIHSGERPHACVLCGKRFTAKTYLIKHHKIHTDAHSCNVCNKRFQCNSELAEHLNIHTGERPFSCDICCKCFTSKTHLNRHMKTHIEHNCGLCGKNCTSRKKLLRHLMIHPDIGRTSLWL